MKILIALSGSNEEDGTPASGAVRFPWPPGSEIHVLSVAEILQPAMVGMIPDAIDAGEVQIRTDQQARTTATLAALQLRKLGFAAEGKSVEGEPETAILDYAKSWGADLIVVGSHDRSRMEKLLMGSIPEAMAKHAPCSVLILKHPAF